MLHLHDVLRFVTGRGWDNLPLVNVIAGSTLLLAAAWATAVLMRRSPAASRHLVWCAALAGLLCLPVLSAVLPAWHVLPTRVVADDTLGTTGISSLTYMPPLAIAPADLADVSAEPAAVHQPAWRPSLQAWLAMIWAAGAILVLLPPLLGRWFLLGVERSCLAGSGEGWELLLRQARRDLGLARPVTLLLSAARTTPMAWGIRRPKVLLPAEARDWPADRRRVVLLHELGHVKRWDCLTHLLGQVARAVYWFHPLAWVAVWKMQAERERACDDLVLRLGTPQADYAHELVEVTAQLQPPQYAIAGIAMATRSRLEQRVREILDKRRDRRGATRRHVLVAAALVTLLAVPVAVMRGGISVQGQTITRNQISYQDKGAPIVNTLSATPANASTSLRRENGRTWIEGIRPGQPGTSTYAQGLAVLLQHLGHEDADYIRVMGYSGVAFSLQMHTQGPIHNGYYDLAWWPNDSYAFDMRVGFVAQAFGRELRRIESGPNVSDAAEEYRGRFEPEIIRSIDLGRPVLGNQSAALLINGYDQVSHKPIGLWPTPGQPVFGPTNDSIPWGIYVPGERTAQLPKDQAELESLRWAVALWDGTAGASAKDAGPSVILTGAKAWQKWLDLLADCTGLGAVSKDMNMISHLRYNRTAAIAYLRGLAGRRSGAVAAHLLAAADCYEQVLQATANAPYGECAMDRINAAIAAGTPPRYDTPAEREAYVRMIESVVVSEKRAIDEIRQAIAAAGK